MVVKINVAGLKLDTDQSKNPCGGSHSGKCGTSHHTGTGHGHCYWCKKCN